MTATPTPAMPLAAPPERSPLKAAFSSRGFLLAVVVLAIAAAGLNTAAQALKMYFQKQPVYLRQPLHDEGGVPRVLGHWVSVQQTSTLNEDVQHALGTKDFVFRTYVNSRVAGRDVVDKLVNLSREIDGLDPADNAQARAKKLKQAEFNHELRRVQMATPEAVMALNVTYYTGMVDTVAHVPERCMVADGYEPKNPRLVEVKAGELPGGEPRNIVVSFATFEDQTGHSRVGRNIAYVFHCNGGYEPSSVGVRGKLQNLFEKHGYYAKVELMTDEPLKAQSPRGGAEVDHQKSIDAMADILAVALPEVERCLPDWNAIKSGATTQPAPQPAPLAQAGGADTDESDTDKAVAAAAK